MKTPLILITNDDGIHSQGLWATVEAVQPLADVLVVAPDRQWSGGGRSMPPHVTGRIQQIERQVNGQDVTAYAVDASPALATVHGVIELAPRRPNLVISGVNSGANLGTEVTISGTVGAALEGGAFGIPALAVSLEMDSAYHLTGHDGADYAAAIAFTRRFAELMLACPLPDDVHALNINIPSDATPQTPWRMVRLARQRYFIPTPPDRSNGTGRPGYILPPNLDHILCDTDTWALMVERIVTVTPLSLDLTSRVELDTLASWIEAKRTDQALS